MPLYINNSTYSAFLILSLQLSGKGYSSTLTTCDGSRLPGITVTVPQKFEKFFLQQFSCRLPILIKLNSINDNNQINPQFEIEDIMIVSTVNE